MDSDFDVSNLALFADLKNLAIYSDASISRMFLRMTNSFEFKKFESSSGPKSIEFSQKAVTDNLIVITSC